MAVGQPARLHPASCDLRLRRARCRRRPPAREHARGAGELAVDRRQRTLRRGEIGLDAAQFGLRAGSSRLEIAPRPPASRDAALRTPRRLLLGAFELASCARRAAGRGTPAYRPSRRGCRRGSPRGRCRSASGRCPARAWRSRRRTGRCADRGGDLEQVVLDSPTTLTSSASDWTARVHLRAG